MTSLQDLIWTQADWPYFRYDEKAFTTVLGGVRHAQGVAQGRLAGVGMVERTDILALPGPRQR